MSADWPETCDQQTFAALRGVKPPMVCRWKQRGLLVMTTDGKAVRVRESMARLDEMLSPVHGGDRSGTAKPAQRKAPAQAAPEMRDSYVAEAAAEKRVSRLLKELELAKARGELVEREAIGMHYARLAAAARAELMALPRRLASSFDPDPSACERALRAGIVKACEKLAEPDFGCAIAVVRADDLQALRGALGAVQAAPDADTHAALVQAVAALLLRAADAQTAPALEPAP